MVLVVTQEKDVSTGLGQMVYYVPLECVFFMHANPLASKSYWLPVKPRSASDFPSVLYIPAELQATSGIITSFPLAPQPLQDL